MGFRTEFLKIIKMQSTRNPFLMKEDKMHIMGFWDIGTVLI